MPAWMSRVAAVLQSGPYIAYATIIFVALAVAALVSGFAGNTAAFHEAVAFFLPCLAAVIGGSGILIKDRQISIFHSRSSRDYLSLASFVSALGLLGVSFYHFVQLKKGVFSAPLTTWVFAGFALAFFVIVVIAAIVWIRLPKSVTSNVPASEVVASWVILAIPLLVVAVIYFAVP